MNPNSGTPPYDAGPFDAAQSRAVMFPELDDGDGIRTVLDDRDDPALASRGGRLVWVLAPGPLLTPNFRPHAPWLSGTVTAVWHDGTPRPGAIEAALRAPASPAALAPAKLARATAAAARLVGEGLGGTFWAPPPTLPPGRILVAATGSPARAAARLEAALAAHEAAAVVLLLPAPKHVAQHARSAGCAVLSAPIDPWPLLAAATAFHAPTMHPLALLARLAHVPVHPDSDEDAWPASEGDAGAILLDGTRYADPFTRMPIECEAALDIAAEWRRVTRLNRGIGAMAGMSFWKRRRMAAFFHDGERAPPHASTAARALKAAKGHAVAAWSSRLPKTLLDQARARNVPVLRVEDGFIRSAGLGSGFLPPGSVIADATGIYYDPAGPSDLETLLRTAEFPPALLARAQALAARLVRDGVTKYGAAAADVVLPDAGGRRRVLVPGQVADDLSVRLGGAGIPGNAELLARVRVRNPGAYVIYKPHPDVDAGHRAGTVPAAALARDADLVLRGTPMAALIDAVDEVHTLTSLAGFEALLRGKRVVVHGQPFYAGWGLTEDLAPALPRRGRRLTIDELTAGLLLLYARYVDPLTELPCPAEVLLDRIATRHAWPETRLMRLRRWQGALRARLAQLRG